LLGANIGSSIVPFASLATLITLSAARRRGAAIRDVDVLATGIWMTPLVLVATALTLAVSFR
jgi:Na+/H+ antiporter NhaD/arsenite permease-like protein